MKKFKIFLDYCKKIYAFLIQEYTNAIETLKLYWKFKYQNLWTKKTKNQRWYVRIKIAATIFYLLVTWLFHTSAMSQVVLITEVIIYLYIFHQALS